MLLLVDGGKETYTDNFQLTNQSLLRIELLNQLVTSKTFTQAAYQLCHLLPRWLELEDNKTVDNIKYHFIKDKLINIRHCDIRGLDSSADCLRRYML